MFIEKKELFHWRLAKRNKREVSYCKHILISGLVVMSAVCATVQAGPTGEQVTGGSAAFTRPDVNTTNIRQDTPRVDINWTGFDTTAAETVNFAQPNDLAVAINRISGARTRFDGTLNANGRIFLINQNGLTIGNGAAVNVGSLLVTTSLMDEEELIPQAVSTATLPGNTFNFHNAGGDPGRSIDVENGGRITITSPGGFAVLVAPNVTNNGIIENGPNAPMVQIELASAGDFGLNADVRGDGLITYSLGPEFFDGGESDGATGVTNNGTLQAHSGSIYVSAHMASEIVNGVVNLNGIVDADQFVSTPDGVVAKALVPVGESFPGGQIHVASVGDINIGGGADIHAIGGDRVRADFNAADDINMGVDGNPAKIVLKGVNDVNGPNGEDGERDAELTMQAGTDGSGSLRINGDIEVTADNTSRGSAAGLYAGAEAAATLGAANDVTVTTGSGTIRVAAVADDVVGSYADADASLSITAGNSEGGGDLTITGNVEVTAAGASTSGEAQGEADASLRGDNVSIAGDMTVAGTGLASGVSTNRDDAVGSAELDVNATTGDLNITGDISVTAEGSVPDSGSYAGADASASLRAAHDVNITTDRSTIRVASITDGATGGSYADADASLDIHAGNSEEGGDLAITGDIEVTATGTVTSGSAEGEADASLSGDNVTINGDVMVAGTGTVNGSDSSGDDALGSAFLDIQANAGDLNITGDVSVMSKGSITGDYEATASVEAGADLGGRSVTVDGNVTVSADASASGSESVYDADAVSDLVVTAWGEQGDLSITGDINVDAKAVRSGSYSSDATANANASLSAGRDLSVGNITVVSTAENDGIDSRDTAADSTLEMYAGNSGIGSLDVNGDVTVRSNASVGAEGSSAASATANAVMFAADDITIRGDTTVEATASNVGRGFGADALAALTVVAGTGFQGQSVTESAVPAADGTQGGSGMPGDLSVSGDVTVRADASTNGSTATADANAVLLATGDVNMSGDIDIGADAKATSENGSGNGYRWLRSTGDADANASLLMLGGAGTDIGIGGSQRGTADEIAAFSEEIIKSGGLEGSLGELPLFGEGGVSFVGDIKVAASSDLNVTGTGSGSDSGEGSGELASGFSEATAAALIAGGGDVLVDTDRLLSVRRRKPITRPKVPVTVLHLWIQNQSVR